MGVTHPSPHIMKLRLGYSLRMDQPDSDVYWLSTRVQLYKNRRIIFSDTDHEIMPRDKIYPMVLHFHDHDEVLLQCDNRPSMETALRLFVKGASVVSMDTLPSFWRNASDLASDGTPRFAGVIDAGEEWEDSLGRHRTTYNPILYYKITGAGLTLDSAMTTSIDRRIYGKFYGFDMDNEQYFPAEKALRAFTNEQKRIDKARKLPLNGF